MNLKALKFTLKGSSPLLMNQFTGEEKTGKNDTKEAQAEEHTYRSENGNLCIPQANFMRALVKGAAGTLVGGKGKKTYKNAIASGVYLLEPELDLGTKDYVVDSKPVVIKATGGRVLRHRARINRWAASGTLQYDPAAINEKDLKKILQDTGAVVGLMDFRPEKFGPFGRFEVEF